MDRVPSALNTHRFDSRPGGAAWGGPPPTVHCSTAHSPTSGGGVSFSFSAGAPTPRASPSSRVVFMPLPQSFGLVGHMGRLLLHALQGDDVMIGRGVEGRRPGGVAEGEAHGQRV